MMNHPFLQHQAFNQPSATMGQSMPTMGQPMQQLGQTLPIGATPTTTSRLSPKPDLSAFDSLLGPAQNSQKQSMSSLQNLGGNMAQPMTPRNPMMTGLNIQQTTNAARPLSNTDINDLLSWWRIFSSDCLIYKCSIWIFQGQFYTGRPLQIDIHC